MDSRHKQEVHSTKYVMQTNISSPLPHDELGMAPTEAIAAFQER